MVLRLNKFLRWLLTLVVRTASLPHMADTGGSRMKNAALKLAALAGLASAFYLGTSMTNAKPAHACAGVLDAVAVVVHAEDARYEKYNGDDWIWTTGSILQWPDYFCTVDQSTIAAQTRACGFWGCSWETRDSEQRTPRQVYWRETPGFACRSGTHRYQGKVTLNYRVFDVINNIPVLIPGNPVIDDSTIDYEVTCK